MVAFCRKGISSGINAWGRKKCIFVLVLVSIKREGRMDGI